MADPKNADDTSKRAHVACPDQSQSQAAASRRAAQVRGQEQPRERESGKAQERTTTRRHEGIAIGDAGGGGAGGGAGGGDTVLRETIGLANKYELARLVGQRAQQLENGEKPLIDLRVVSPTGQIQWMTDPLEIATEELRQRALNMVVRRQLHPGAPHEDWPAADLALSPNELDTTNMAAPTSPRGR